MFNGKFCRTSSEGIGVSPWLHKRLYKDIVSYQIKTYEKNIAYIGCCVRAKQTVDTASVLTANLERLANVLIVGPPFTTTTNVGIVPSILQRNWTGSSPYLKNVSVVRNLNRCTNGIRMRGMW